MSRSFWATPIRASGHSGTVGGHAVTDGNMGWELMSENGTFPSPRLVFWETTAGCNLACSHCRRTEVADEVSSEELTTEEAEKLIDELAGWGRSTVLVFSGGEPLLRPDIFHLMSYAYVQGLVIALATNGTLIDTDTAVDIRESGADRVSVSLDGADEITHDAFRRLPGSFRSAVAGAQALRAQDVSLQINVTVAKHNADQLDDMVGLAQELGATALHLFLLVPVGCGMEIAAEQTLQADAYERTLGWLYDTERKETGLQLRATCAPHYFRVANQSQVVGQLCPVPPGGSLLAHSHSYHHPGGGNGHGPAGLHAATRGCLAGTGVCFVSHTGKVYGCGYMPIEAGDLRRQPLTEVWQSSGFFAELRDLKLLKGKCGGCGYVKVCGGCRARAYGSTGDPLAEEPLCAYEPRGRR
jgi:radical SAM protein with 4Fe4S-binding SPASM domain